MFGIGIGEVFVVMLLAAVLIPPKDMPAVVRFLAKAWRKIAAWARSVRMQINELAGSLDDVREADDDTYDLFRDQIEEQRRAFSLRRSSFYDELEDKKTPTLKISGVENKKKAKK
ncbi:MAG: hypothetical protein LBO78_00295 [Rickettsiales bacterium]|nr:hypothetical protein [Rickettsiales bacterium]